MSGERNYEVLSVSKAIRLLRAFHEADANELSLAELSRLTGEHKTVVYRLAMTLCDHGCLERNPVTKRFAIGRLIFVLSNYYKRVRMLRQHALPVLRSITQEYGHSGYLVVLDGYECMAVAALEGWQHVKVAVRTGERRPAYATAFGKAILSTFSDEELADYMDHVELVPVTEKTIVDREALLADIRFTRERGYAFSLEEMSVGVTAVGAPILGRDGKAVAAMSVAFPTHLVPPEELQPLAEVVRNEAARVSRSLEAEPVEPGE